MQLSPTLRWLLGGLSAAITTFGGLVAADQILASSLPAWVGVALSVAGAVLAFLLVPPQVGGTQQGIVNPSVVEPPAADVSTTYPSATGGTLGAFWPVAVLPFAADRVDSGEALFWIGVLVVVGCLVAAAVVAYRFRDWLVPLILVGIAIVAAVLLL